jgi:iron complex outermembrane recepter protein
MNLKPHELKGSINGKVIKKDSSPIIDAYLSVSGNSPNHSDITALTNNNGEYELNNLRPGVYEIDMYADGFTSQKKIIQVFANKTSTLNFTV